MIKLCIFDLDGTVLDTVATIAHYGNYALIKNGVEPIEENEYKYLAGTGASNLIRNMLNLRGCYSTELYQKVFSDYNSAYNANVSYKSRVFDGLKESLDKLRSEGVLLAVVSNKPHFAAKSVVEELYGEDYFSFVTGHKEGMALKPDPTAVLDLISSFGVKREECIYFGDTSTDMKTGKNAGLLTVGVLWGFRDKKELIESGADIVTDEPGGLYGLVKEAGER